MITARFYVKDNLVTGFSVSGHAGFAPKGGDIVCASVSSAAYMAVNTITEVVGVKSKPEESDGFLELLLNEDEANQSQTLLKGFEIHMSGLQAQYPQRIRIIYGGYKNA